MGCQGAPGGFWEISKEPRGAFGDYRRPARWLQGGNTPKQGLLSDGARALCSPPQEHQRGSLPGWHRQSSSPFLGGSNIV